MILQIKRFLCPEAAFPTQDFWLLLNTFFTTQQKALT